MILAIFISSACGVAIGLLDGAMIATRFIMASLQHGFNTGRLFTRTAIEAAMDEYFAKREASK